MSQAGGDAAGRSKDLDPPGRRAATGGSSHARRTRSAGRRDSGGFLGTLRESVVVLVVALALASLLRAFVVQAFVVPSQSMENTLMGGDGVNDRIVVDKLPGQTVRRGEIVVFSDPGGWLGAEGDPATAAAPGTVRRVLEFVGVVPNNATGHLVKRVIGVGGDRVASKGNGAPVTVNGVPLAESSYLHPASQPSEQPFSVTVPAGHLWVMGDNRAQSSDSRFSHPSGPFVPVSDVTGRVVAVVYPLGRLSRERIPATFARIPPARGGSR